MNDKMHILKHIKASAEAIKSLQTQLDSIIDISDQIIKAFKRGNKLLIFGNGGSAADAQHIAAEFSGRFYLNRDSLPAIALNTNVASLTAIANDLNYESTFSREISSLAREGDVVIAISTSGNSPNVLKGVEEAKNHGAITIAFTGLTGKLKDMVTFALTISSTDTPRIQEGYMVAGHIICYLVEKALFDSEVY
ncbi:SIS domain-containing protein [Chloroflexota bacterium]